MHSPTRPELPPRPDCFLLEATRSQHESVLYPKIELREVIHEGGVEVPVMLLLFDSVHEVDEVPEVIATVVAQDNWSLSREAGGAIHSRCGFDRGLLGKAASVER